MKKSLLFLLTLVSATLLFWGCDDDKTVTNTAYVPVNISEIIDTIGLDIYEFVKKDTILDTTKGDTSFITNTQTLEYGTVLYSTGSFNCYVQKISVDRKHIRSAFVIRDLTIYDTLSSDTISDTVFNSTDTLFIDSIASYDSTKVEIKGADAFNDTVIGTISDTIITSNNSYLMTVNGSSAGYVGLGYLMYTGAKDVSITGLSILEEGDNLIAHNSSVFLLTNNTLVKYNDESLSEENPGGINFPSGSNISDYCVYGDSLLVADNALNAVYIINLSNMSFTKLYEIVDLTYSLKEIEIINNKLLVSIATENDMIFKYIDLVLPISRAFVIDSSNIDSIIVDSLNPTDTTVIYLIDSISIDSIIIDTINGNDTLFDTTFNYKYDTLRLSEVTIANAEKGTNQIFKSYNGKLLILTSRNDTGYHGALELMDFSGTSDTSLGVISSARYVPAGLKDINLISENKGYVLDINEDVLYQINYSAISYGGEADFLTEVASNVASYTINNNHIFVSTNNGELFIYSHSDFITPIKEASISSGAAISLSILSK